MNAGKKKDKQSSFTTRQGVVLSLAVGAFVALVFVLVALFWHPPQ
jgi:uncharacterized ion transporter superfamily protein YfcC